MSKEQIKFLLDNSIIPFDYVSDLKTILNEETDESSPILSMIMAFNYGIIIGKRQDRARRKKSGVNA